MYYGVTQDDDHGERPKRRRRRDAPKERVLHTRVPAVLEQELKALAKNLRVPVSNVVRAILEDAVDAVDTVGEVAQGELLGFVDRLSAQREGLRERVRRGAAGDGDDVEDAEIDEDDEESAAAQPPCPDDPGDLLEGVYGFQSLVLASDTECTACGRTLPAGAEACRALFDEPGKRVFLGPDCRLLPEKKEQP